jgi:Na+-transporting methylmalonyl-CoA/oxaloacetate decarboxylase gamma subunit
MQNALLITGIGMGIVFLALLLVWGLMEILMQYTRERKVELTSLPEEPITIQVTLDKRKIAALAVAAVLQQRRYQAAQQAVGIALKKEEPQAQAINQNGKAEASQWQPVMRALQREERMRLFTRKPRG